MRLVVELQLPTGPGVEVLDVLARLQLLARRLGGGVRVSGDDGLVRLCGLSDVLSGVGQPDREPQPDEELVPEEVVDVGDPPS